MPKAHKETTGDPSTATATRSFWSGTISFGLVSVPVDLLAANRGVARGLRMLGPQGQPLKRKYICAQEGTDVSNDEIVRGYEVEAGQFVTVSDEELEAIEPDKSRDIDLNRFVPKEDISAAYFERGYVLVPAGNSNKAYRLLAHTMETANKAGIGTFVMRGKAYVMAIFAEAGVLHGQTLRFYDELRKPEDIGVTSKHKADPKLVAQMTKRIEAQQSDEFSPQDLQDEDEATVRSIAEAKWKKRQDVVEVVGAEADASEEGEDSESVADAPQGKLIDLMEVLRQRLAQSETAAKPTAHKKPAAKRPKKAKAASKAPRAKATKTARAKKTSSKASARRG